MKGWSRCEPVWELQGVADNGTHLLLVTREDGRQVPALCYLLPQVTGTRRNTTYAVKLLELATTLAFPGAYLATLQRLTQEETASNTGREKQHDG